ncbi:DUF4926 domain-containing protein [Spirulina subsalsa FACHB-351]|uniref:DUF4926 domain-containing protein n=1 Tax=Spirulina subsalsa FACHB-351 TaxID=234711 RepID=A0ABT3L1S4_9CYAN|nr:DUF4926 domain-containing protein [Spirulina subsalsa]MCW6034975.1 DUF4926 domain-containing protein [Spirulina subsalsa FACHB-351]
MKLQYPLFSQVALTEDLPQYHLKRGDIATIVEHYPMPDPQEDGYSLEGFDLPHITLEVAASQIMPMNDYLREEAILSKFRNLSQNRQTQLEEYLDFLLQKDQTTPINHTH